MTLHICRHVTAVMACALAAPLIAQTATPGAVRGTITFGDTGAPAQGVFVNLLPPPPPAPAKNGATGEYIVRDVPGRQDYHAQVDAQGRFTISNVPPGTYTVQTYAPGYLSPESGKDGAVLGGAPLPEGDNREIHVSSGSTREIDLRLQRGGAIEGNVYSGDGRASRGTETPAAGIAVNAERKLDDGRLVRTGGAAHTDASGHYRLDGLAPGSYVVFAALPAAMVQTSHGMVGSGGEIIYAPGTVRGSHARSVLVQGPETIPAMNLILPTSNLHTISGTVLSNGTLTGGYGLVRLYPTGEPGLSRATPIGIGGNFSFSGVPDEQYTLATEFSPKTEVVGVSTDRQSVRMRMGSAPYSNATTDVSVSGSDVTGLVLQVSPNTP